MHPEEHYIINELAARLGPIGAAISISAVCVHTASGAVGNDLSLRERLRCHPLRLTISWWTGDDTPHPEVLRCEAREDLKRLGNASRASFLFARKLEASCEGWLVRRQDSLAIYTGSRS